MLGLFTPLALADETATLLESGSTSDGTAVSGGSSTSESTSSSGGEAYAPPADSGGSTPSASSDTGAASGDSAAQVEQPAPTDQGSGDRATGDSRSGDGASAVSGPTGGGAERAERSPAADSRAPAIATGQSAGDTAASVADDSAPFTAAGPDLPPASGVTGSADLSSGLLGGANTAPGLLAIDTGGIKLLLASSSGCESIPCDGRAAAGSLGSPALASRVGNRAATASTVTEASERSLLSIIGLPGTQRGPFFGLFGGGGGATGFLLLTFLAVLAALLVRRIDWTTPLRLPAAAWPSPVYLSPLESPG
jgi:hypothetical protein